MILSYIIVNMLALPVGSCIYYCRLVIVYIMSHAFVHALSVTIRTTWKEWMQSALAMRSNRSPWVVHARDTHELTS